MVLTDLEQTIENLNEYNARTNNYERGWKLLRKYQERLKEEVKLWMFVPCGSDGEMLLKPKYNSSHDEILFEAKFARYEKAMNRVLFKNINTKVHFEDVVHVYINNAQMVTIAKDNIWFEPNTFEDVINLCDNEVELTESGQKYFEI